MTSRSSTVQPPHPSVSRDSEAPTLQLPVASPTPPHPTGRARRTVRRILVGLLLLLVGLVLLGALLSPGAPTPAATDTGSPSITDTVPSIGASPPAPGIQTPPVVEAEPVPVAPRTVAPEPVARRPVATEPATAPRVPTPRTAVPSADPEPDRQSTSYANCAEVRAAGAAPIRRGEPGFSSKLDRDGDGVGCET